MTRLGVLLATAAGLCLVVGGVGCTPSRNAESVSALWDRVDSALTTLRARRLRSDAHTPWVILHGVIAFEQELEIFDAAAGQNVNAVVYLLTRAEHEGRRIIRDRDGVPALPPWERDYQVQDHVDQFLSALADASVPLDAPLLAEGGGIFAVRDLLRAAQRDFRLNQELGWSLVAFSTYLSPGVRWTTSEGTRTSVESIARLAIGRDVSEETEGGAHHLYGLAYALERERDRAPGRPLESPWTDVERYLARHVALARRHQQPDGAFSHAMLGGSLAPPDPGARVWSTGHTLEWITVAVDAQELARPWVQRAVARLCRDIEEHPPERFGDGSFYHAAHALRRYREALAPRTTANGNG